MNRWIIILIVPIYLAVSAATARSADHLDVSEAFVGPDPLLVGGAGYLTGVGLIYGGVVGAKDIFDGRTDLMVVASGGGVQALGVVASDIPLYKDRLSLSFGFGDVQSAEFETSYARGLDESLVFRQELQGQGSFVSYDLRVWSDRLFVRGGFAYSQVRFVNFKTQGGTVIPFNRGPLHDVETQTTRFGIFGHMLKPETSSGHDLSAQLDMIGMMGRLAQSDIDIFVGKVKGEQQLSNKYSLAYTWQMQTTQAKNKGPTTVSVSGNCGSIADANIRAQCEQLEKDFSSFTGESNDHGSAIPIGGSRGLRSFRELRFRAANTSLTGLELRRDFAWKFPMQLGLFYELGHANDDMGRLFERSVSSYGLGFRVFVSDMPIRLEVASGTEGEAAFLTLGQAW